MAEAEIIGPDGDVHYRRPHDHKDIREALSTIGYSVRVPGRGMDILNDINLESSQSYAMSVDCNGILIRSHKGPESGAKEQW